MSTDPTNFAGLRVASFESRRADDMERMIARFGGVPFVSPSMREVSIGHNRAAIDFANRLDHGRHRRHDFLTGVGTRMLVQQIERHVDREQFLAAVSDVKTVVRGPKPLAVLKELGITPTIVVPEPNTWREILLATLDEKLPVANLVVGVQEYGVTNRSLVAGLEARGATVESVHVYDWALAGRLRATGTKYPPHRCRRNRRGDVHFRQPGIQFVEAGGRTGRYRRSASTAFATLWSPRSDQLPARCSATKTCRSTWNPRIPKWDIWWMKRRSGRGTLTRKRP